MNLYQRLRRWLTKEGIEGVQVVGTGLNLGPRAPKPYTQEECRGVEVGERCFDWYGPTLHSFEDRPGTPTPPAVLDAIREKGLTATYAPANQLAAFLEWQKYQVFETDRKTWRRPVVHGDGLLLVVHDPTFFDGLILETSS